jgi:hypothetical protein
LSSQIPCQATVEPLQEQRRTILRHRQTNDQQCHLASLYPNSRDDQEANDRQADSRQTGRTADLSPLTSKPRGSPVSLSPAYQGSLSVQSVWLPFTTTRGSSLLFWPPLLQRRPVPETKTYLATQQCVCQSPLSPRHDTYNTIAGQSLALQILPREVQHNAAQHKPSSFSILPRYSRHTTRLDVSVEEGLPVLEISLSVSVSVCKTAILQHEALPTHPYRQGTYHARHRQFVFCLSLLARIDSIRLATIGPRLA